MHTHTHTYMHTHAHLVTHTYTHGHTLRHTQESHTFIPPEFTRKRNPFDNDLTELPVTLWPLVALNWGPWFTVEVEAGPRHAGEESTLFTLAQ